MLPRIPPDCSFLAHHSLYHIPHHLSLWKSESSSYIYRKEGYFQVVGCFVTVLLRVLRGICRFILWDEADYEEEDRRMAEEKGAEARKLLEEREARREEARARRREERRRLREEAKEELRQLLAQVTILLLLRYIQDFQTNGKPKVTNGVSKQTVIREEPRQSSDNSDSLISECEDENSQATSGIVVSESRPRKADHLKSAH